LCSPSGQHGLIGSARAGQGKERKVGPFASPSIEEVTNPTKKPFSSKAGPPLMPPSAEQLTSKHGDGSIIRSRERSYRAVTTPCPTIIPITSVSSIAVGSAEKFRTPAMNTVSPTRGMRVVNVASRNTLGSTEAARTTKSAISAFPTKVTEWQVQMIKLSGAIPVQIISSSPAARGFARAQSRDVPSLRRLALLKRQTPALADCVARRNEWLQLRLENNPNLQCCRARVAVLR
jgi:hypothetical protein